MVNAASEQYLNYLTHERRLAALTLKHYRRDLVLLEELVANDNQAKPEQLPGKSQPAPVAVKQINQNASAQGDEKDSADNAQNNGHEVLKSGELGGLQAQKCRCVFLAIEGHKLPRRRIFDQATQ